MSAPTGVIERRIKPSARSAEHFGYKCDNGYAHKQVQDDTQHGKNVIGDGNRGQVLAVGPSVKYQTKAVDVIMKWQHKPLVQKRTKGDRIWLQMAYHFFIALVILTCRIPSLNLSAITNNHTYSCGAKNMPIISINMLQGRTAEQKI